MKVLCLLCNYYSIEWIHTSLFNISKHADEVVNEGSEENQNHCMIDIANGTVDNSTDESNEMDVEQGKEIILY